MLLLGRRKVTTSVSARAPGAYRGLPQRRCGIPVDWRHGLRAIPDVGLRHRPLK